MRIALCGVTDQGQNLFIQDFLQQWPMYKKSIPNYQTILAKTNLVGKEGTEEHQNVLLNSLIVDATKYQKSDNIIHENSVLDNIVFSMWLADKKITNISDAFIQKSILLIREALHFYDIIFYFPATITTELSAPDEIATENKIREEISNIYSAIHESYVNGQELFFEFSSQDGAPAMIEIFGNRPDKIQIAKLYIDETGNAWGKKASDSLITLPTLEEQVEIDRLKAMNNLQTLPKKPKTKSKNSK